jgi:hypothetical protein
MLETDNNFCNVLLGPVFGKSTEVLDERTTISTVEVLHDEVEVVFRLKGVVQFDDEVRFCGGHENHSFCLDVRDLILCYHVGLFEYFDRVVIPSRNFFGKIDGADWFETRIVSEEYTDLGGKDGNLQAPFEIGFRILKSLIEEARVREEGTAEGSRGERASCALGLTESCELASSGRSIGERRVLF